MLVATKMGTNGDDGCRDAKSLLLSSITVAILDKHPQCSARRSSHTSVFSAYDFFLLIILLFHLKFPIRRR